MSSYFILNHGNLVQNLTFLLALFRCRAWGGRWLGELIGHGVELGGGQVTWLGLIGGFRAWSQGPLLNVCVTSH